MRLFDLTLKNIGPFPEAFLKFIEDGDDPIQPPVTIITGENGTGKTVVIDAIRAILLGGYGSIERNIVRDHEDFEVSLSVNYKSKTENIKSLPDVGRNTEFNVSSNSLNRAFADMNHRVNNPQTALQDINWVVDYWTSKLATDPFKITNLISPNPENYLSGSLSGIHKNVEVTQLICYFDYLRGSESPKEKEAGEYLYNQLKEIIRLSLNNGELAYVSRARLEPIIIQNKQEITLDKLSSGNLYLIQRMVSLLGKMYSVHLLKNTPIDAICQTPGLLLIDEAENHLHPKWQKTFISNVLDIFPNLQIILTTHSPFIVSSVKSARIYVCESRVDHCRVTDETSEYSNKPIEEILLSPLFGGTYPFSQEITELLQERKKAIASGNKAEEDRIEARLKTINPTYFAYLDIENMLGQLKNPAN
jgi:predicted ATP-binding protein involved in virulence